MKIKTFLIIFLATVILFLPIIARPSLYLHRGNDLEEFFWPIYYFVKNQILEQHTFPFWNNLFLSGTPLLPDPQSPLFYPPNLLFLLFPLNPSFILIAFFHILLGGIGCYYLARELKLNHQASLTAAILYLLSPKVASYLEAGHVGLVNTWAWVPFALWSTLKLSKKPCPKWSILLGISLAGLFYTHTIIFLITGLFLFPLFLATSSHRKTDLFKSTLYFFLAGTITFGLIAITFLPQLAWKDLTTRDLLLTKRQIHPIWTSKSEFLLNITAPWLNQSGLQSIETEKWIPLGFFLSLLSFLGFLKVSRKLKIILLSTMSLILLISLGNASPLYPFLIRQDWFALMRIPTRMFLPIILVSILLASYAVNQFKFARFLAFLAITESIFLSWAYLQKPILPRVGVPDKIYTILQNDPDHFRVLCLTRCLPQKEAAKRQLELVEGYSTLIQKNYYSHSLQLIGGYWDYYSIPLPPTGVYLFQDLKPNVSSLADYNTKYVIHTKELSDSNLKFLGKYDQFYLYENLIAKPRASAPITFYSPNKIIINTQGYTQPSIITSEVYSPGWKAYLNGTEKVSIEETPSSLRSIPIKPDTSFVIIKYEPPLANLGKIITLSTYLTLAVFLVISQAINLSKHLPKASHK